MDRDKVIRQILDSSQTVQMSRRELVDQMIKHIKSIALDPEEVKALYSAITGRMIWRRCSVCLKTKLEIEGKMVFKDGDLSKPKQFICKDC